MRHLVRILFLLIVVFLAAEAGSQSGRPVPVPDPPPAPRLQQQQGPPLEERFRLERERAMARQRNKDRQAALKKDTDKLLELATQLKEYVDKTDENMLSLDVIKKAEEIEKLSKSVKEKMKADEYYPPTGSNLNYPR